MNSSDEFRDQQLRETFQQVLNGLKRQPAPSAKAQIFGQIPHRTPPYRRYGWLGMAILLLVSMGIYWVADRKGVGPISLPSQPPTGNQLAKSIPVTEQAGPQPVVRATQPKRVATGQPEMSLAFPRPSSPSPAVHRLASRQEPGRFNQSKPPAGSQRVALSAPEHAQQSMDPDRIIAHARLVAQSPIPSKPLLSMTQTIEEKSSVVPFCLSRPLFLSTGLQEAINRPVMLAHPPSQVATPPARLGRAVRWLVGVTPLSTYQWTTIVTRPQTYVRQVDAPAAFAGPTWGYQLSGGLQWRQTVLQLTAGSIRRWAYYEVATSAFRVKSVGPAQYETTPLSQPVTENVSLLMLGGSARQQWQLGGPQSPYFVRLGGALSYVPHTGQSLVWANASMGLSLPLTNAYSIQLGPTVEYGVSRLWSEQRQLIIHPYLVGATLSIQANHP